MSVDDYPLKALQAGHQGPVTVLFDIDVTGLPSDCRIAVSSGYPELDQATCKGVLKRARFSPALDKDGKPIVSMGSRVFFFSMGN